MTPSDELDDLNRTYYDADAKRYDATRFADALGVRASIRTRGLISDTLEGADYDCAVEVGPGTGRITYELLTHVRRLTLVDVSPEMLSSALSSARLGEHEGNSCRVHGIVGSIYQLPCQTGSQDLVVSVNLLSHIRYAEPAIGELSRVLRPGGRLIFSTTNLMSAYLPAGILVNIRGTAIGQRVPSRWHRRSDLTRHLERHGLKIDAVFGAYYLPRAARRVPGVARLVVRADERERARPPGNNRTHAPWLLYSCWKVR